MKQRFISGADIVDKRNWREAQLRDAFLNHGLGCYRPHSVVKEYDHQSCIACKYDGARDKAEPGDECFHGRRGCDFDYDFFADFGVFIGRLMECDFDLEDIEKFEREHFLGAGSETKDAPFHAEKPLGTRERRTHQVIIAALCQNNKIGPRSRDAVSRLVRLTEEIGAGVGEDKIRQILKELPDSIESRMK